MEQQLLLLMITGVAAGFMNVMARGGSLLTLPVMSEFLGLTGPVANGTNRIAVVPGIALAGGSAAGSWIGTHFAVKKGDRIIRVCLNVALAALVIKLLLSRA